VNYVGLIDQINGDKLLYSGLVVREDARQIIITETRDEPELRGCIYQSQFP
jgi:hypothetical protein